MSNETDEMITKGLVWESILYPTGGRGVVLTEVGEGGQAIGPPQVAAMPSHGVPTWMPQGGEPTALVDLEPSHRVNLLHYLGRRASGIAFYVSLSWMAGPMGPHGDHATDAALELTDEMNARPVTWLFGTPFMLALVELVEAQGDGNALMTWKIRMAEEQQP